MMKRGLSTLYAERTPEALYLERQNRLRALLREQGFDAAVIYCDVSTGADLAYLTHATLYWSNGLLVVAAEGPTTLLPALSPRTENWFSETGVFDAIVSSTDLSGGLVALSSANGYSRVAVVDAERFPSGLIADLHERLPGSMVPVGSLLRTLRDAPDAAAGADLTRVARIGATGSEHALRALTGATLDDARADAEFAMRIAGAWDASAEVREASGGGVLLRIRCQLRDAWYASEELVGGPDEVQRWTHDLFGELVGRLRAGVSSTHLKQVADAFAAERPLPGAALIDVVLEAASDVESRMPLEEGTQAHPAGRFVHLVVAGWTAEGDPLTARGDTFLLTPNGPAVRAADSAEGDPE